MEIDPMALMGIWRTTWFQGLLVLATISAIVYYIWGIKRTAERDSLTEKAKTAGHHYFVGKPMTLFVLLLALVGIIGILVEVFNITDATF